MTREEAIEYNKNLREYMRITDKVSEYKFLKENYEALDMAIQALEKEQKTGHWIYKSMKGQFCSECDEPCVWKFNYCPNCGTKMKANDF